MKRIIFVLLVLFFGTNVAFTQDAKKKVAVYVTGEVDSGYKKVIGSKMVSGITKSDGYIAVERTSDFLAALSKEQDYQTSGAVNDNQIVKIGQQFGVRYVVVVDVSEVFESMFVSARMIDVQTGQISGSSESSKSVDSLEGLMALSENVATELLGGVAYSDYATTNNVSDIKVLGPVDEDKTLYYHYNEIPAEYHVANREEINSLIKAYKLANKHISFPIYVEIKCKAEQSYNKKKVECWLYSDENNVQEFTDYFNDPNPWPDLGRSVQEFNSITPGYIYLIKNK